MARFKSEGVVVRDLSNLKIIFYTKQSIYVFGHNNPTGVVFHRWYGPIGSYVDGWRTFRQKLYEYKRLDLDKCFALAHQHGVMSAGATSMPDLSERKIIKKD